MSEFNSPLDWPNRTRKVRLYLEKRIFGKTIVIGRKFDWEIAEQLMRDKKNKWFEARPVPDEHIAPWKKIKSFINDVRQAFSETCHLGPLKK